jgi:hypothetical protein
MKQGIGLACLLALAISLSLDASAQPTAEKPKVAIGDKWEFTNKTADGKTTAVSREVVEMPSADVIRIRLETGNVIDLDSSLNFMQDGRVEFTRVLQRFPMKVGDEWAFTRKFPNPSQVETGKGKVVAYESITVPAGTFQCFRVEAEASLVNKTYYRADRKWTRWYCPEVNGTAKQVLDEKIQSGGPGSGTMVETSELVRFTPGK